MTNEFNDDENVVQGIESNEPIVETGGEVNQPLGEESDMGSGNYKPNNSKGIVIVLAIIVALVGLICAFACTNLKYITSPNKMTFINYLDKDVDAVKDFYNDNEFVKFVTNKKPKDLNINFSYSIINMAMNFVLNTDSLAMKYDDKYYLIDYNNLDKLYKTLEIDDEVPSVSADTFSKDDIKEVKKFGKECYNIFTDSLTNDDFTVTKDDKITINGNEVESKSVELKITEEKLLEILRELLKELRSSDLVDIYFEKIGNVEITKEEFLKSIDELLVEIDNSKRLNDYNESYIAYKMYNKDGIIAREFAYCESGDDTSLIRLVTADGYYEFNTELESLYGGNDIKTFSDTVTKEKDATYHDIKFVSRYENREYVPDKSSMSHLIGPSYYEYNPVTEEESFKIKAENNDTKFTLVGVEDIDVVVDINNGLKISIKSDGASVTLTIVDNKELTTEKIMKNGALIINDMTMDELTELFNDLLGVSQLPLDLY